jgi:ferredoxin
VNSNRVCTPTTKRLKQNDHCHLHQKESNMPKLTVEGLGEFEVPQGKRLIAALREEVGSDQLHACGGKARCTTCRVEFLAGEPSKITVAERDILAARGVTGVRLSCQIACDHDMSVRLISRFEGSGRKDCGSPYSEQIEPQPVEWLDR